jgi:hypothetical protein
MPSRWGQSVGDITMTDSRKWKERRNQLARYRISEQQTTEPLAALFLHEEASELEADHPNSSSGGGSEVILLEKVVLMRRIKSRL